MNKVHTECRLQLGMRRDAMDLQMSDLHLDRLTILTTYHT